MNPAITAASTITTIAAAQAAERRKRLLAALEALPRGEATRAALLERHPELEAALDAAQASGLVKARADGTLRVDVEGARARASAQGKVALLVVVALTAVAAGVALVAWAFAG